MITLTPEQTAHMEHAERELSAKIVIHNVGGTETFTITNDSIIDLSVEQSTGTPALTVGSIYSSKATFSLLTTEEPLPLIINNLVEVFYSIGQDWLKLGEFYIDKTSIKKTDFTIDFAAYDIITQLDLVSVHTLLADVKFPLGVDNLLTEVMNKVTWLNIERPSWNSNLQVKKLKDEDYSLRELMSQLAIYYGANIIADNTGRLSFRKFKPVPWAIDSLRYWEYDRHAEELNTITGLTVKSTIETTDSEGKTDIKDIEYTSGDKSGGVFYIEDSNIKSEAEALIVHNQIGLPIQYYPFSLGIQGQLHLEIGDIIQIQEFNDGLYYDAPVINHKMIYNGGSWVSEIKCDPIDTEQNNIGFNGSGVSVKAVMDWLKLSNAQINNLLAGNITADNIKAGSISTDRLTAEKGWIEEGMIGDAVIGSTHIKDASITSAKIVELSANLIKSGTISCERLLITGIDGTEKSLLFYINNAGDLVSENYDSLDGDILTDRTVTADKIVAKSITGEEIAAGTIKAEHILANSITGDKIAANTITGNNIKAGSIDASSLNIGIGQRGGYSVNPLWKKWNDGEALPVGTYRWGDTGRVDIAKISEYGETYLQLWNEQASLQVGVGLNEDFFVKPGALQGVEYFVLEAKFGMKWGTDPTGASFLVDITYQDNTQQRFALDFAKNGRNLNLNTWYTIRQVYAKSSNVPVKSITGYVLGNWVGISAPSAKTIWVANVDVYRASEQDYLTQTWTVPNTTTINGGNIATGSITADKINVADLFAQRVSATNLAVTGNSTIAGFGVTDGKIYGGNPGAGESVIVMQRPIAGTTWAFAVGGNSHADYGNCPFRVTHTGSVYAQNMTLYNKGLYVRRFSASDGAEIVITDENYQPVNVRSTTFMRPESTYRYNYHSNGALRNSSIISANRLTFAESDTNGNYQLITTIDAGVATIGGDVIIPNGHTYIIKDKDGVGRTFGTLDSSNVFYLCHTGAITDTIIGHRSNTNEIHLKARYWVRCGEDTQGFIPNSNGVTSLGLGGFRWSVVYSATGSINTSDRNFKKDIATVDNRYLDMLDMITPSSYKMIDGKSGRTHIGWIAQDVEDAMEKVGLTPTDFAGYCIDKVFVNEKGEDGKYHDIPKLDENGNQVEQRGLRYEEFIPLLHEKIRRLENKLRENGLI